MSDTETRNRDPMSDSWGEALIDREPSDRFLTEQPESYDPAMFQRYRSNGKGYRPNRGKWPSKGDTR